MLNYTSPIKEVKKYSGLTVSEISPLMKLNLRGKSRDFLTTIGQNINIILPLEANTSASSENYTAIWLSPDEWMLVSNRTVNKENNNYEIEKLLFNKISKTNLGSVVDVTDQFVLFELEGSKIYELFSSGSPFDFNDFKEKKGSTTQTLLNNIDVTIHNKGENLVNLFVRRSFSEHLYSWINDSASRL